MIKVVLSQGYEAMIDDEDYGLISKHKWHVSPGKAGNKYAGCGIWQKGKNYTKNVPMHRMIMNVTDPKIQVDHIDGNGLNNQRSNLRLATNQQNSFGSRKSFNKLYSSKYKGVSFDKSREKWAAKIQINRKYKYLGRYETELEAAQAYNVAAVRHFGEYAKINDLSDNELILSFII